MSRAIGWIRGRLSGRPDSEHGQAIVRLVIASVILAYLWILRELQGQPHTDALTLVMLAETLVAMSIMAGILWRPGVSHARRIFGMVTDYATLAVLMSLDAEPLAWLYVIILWVTVGNGMRYGTRYLFLAAGMACLAFGLVIALNPYWHGQPSIAYGLLVGLLAIPAYLSSLLRDLHRRTEEARRASEAKSRFLANMSHEFRSPLNGIIGMTELMDSQRLPPHERECAQVIHASAQTLLMLVEDVLDISAIESGKLQRRARPFRLDDVLGRIGKMLSPSAAAKGLALEVAIDPDVPTGLHGDDGHLAQVLLNLTHNAVKFTEHGSVGLSAHLLGREGDTVRLRFSVRDTGIGIPEEHRRRIFEAFEQVDTGITRRFDGTGLGTTIARTLTEQLGGRIGLEDNPGGGSHFWVEVPLQASDQAPPATAPLQGGNVVDFDDVFVRHRARVRPLRVLIADDQPANRIVLARILERAGHAVVEAGDGEAALDRLADGGFDLCVLDMHMPGLSGLDVMRQLRVMEARGPRTPVVVLSADATPEAAAGASAEGAVAFLTKPVRVPKLLEAIARACGDSPLAREPQPVAAEAGTGRAALLRELAEEGLGGDFLANFVEQCLADGAASLDALSTAAGSARWGAFRDAAHALKGIAENLGDAELARRCQQVMHEDDGALARTATVLLEDLRDGLQRAGAGARATLRELTGGDQRDASGH